MLGPYIVKIDNERKLDTLINDEDGTSVMINRHGCEVIGYRVTGTGGKELPLMYRDGIPEPPQDGWKNHATMLFPIVGGLKNKESKLGDRTVKTPGNHGVARHSTFDLIESGHGDSAWIRYRLEANDYTKKYYPFDFRLDLVFKLEGAVLTVNYEVENTGEDETMPCQFGWHPGFRTPVIPGQGGKKDCRIVFPEGKVRRYHNNPECRLTGETSEIEVGGPLEWTEEELEATLMYEIDDKALRTVSLEDPNAGVSIRLDFPDMPHLGIWSEPGEEFICIEPWQGMDDHEEQEPFDQKVGIVNIPPGGKETRKIMVTPLVS